MRNMILMIFFISLLVNNEIYSQSKSSGFKSSYKSRSSYTYKPPEIRSSKSYKTPSTKIPRSYKSPIYKIGETKYNYSETYKSSGLPKVERNSTNRKNYLLSRGYSRTPKGYEVDHIIPLSKGGQDVPSNMQLLPKEVHKQKTANERKNK